MLVVISYGKAVPGAQKVNFYIEQLINCDGVRLCLRTADTNGPIVHPPGDM
jgi:hypothetical protein